MSNGVGNFKFSSVGVQVSLQDRGRVGYAGFGIPESGFMDRISAARANMVLGNLPEHPCLEFFNGQVHLEVGGCCQVTFSGATMEIDVNGIKYEPLQVISLRDGDCIRLKPGKLGNWLYMAIQGDWIEEEYFGSKSFYTLVTGQGGYLPGQQVHFSSGSQEPTDSHSRVKNQPFWTASTIDAYKGPEFELLDSDAQQQLLNQPFLVTRSMNRMGYQLDGMVTHHLPEILSAPVYPGTVQLTPSGKLIVLMRDAQTTGGYPRVLQLCPKSVSLIAQKRPQDPVFFRILD